MKKQRFCVKSINNNVYLYKWTYIKKCDRNRKKPSKYKWKCIGRLNNPATKRILRTLDKDTYNYIIQSFEKKQQEIKFTQDYINFLKEQSPYKEEYALILSISNSIERTTRMKNFIHKLKSKIKR